MSKYTGHDKTVEESKSALQRKSIFQNDKCDQKGLNSPYQQYPNTFPIVSLFLSMAATNDYDTTK